MNTANREADLQNSRSGANVNINGKSLPIRVFIFCLIAEVSFVLLDAFVNYGEGSKFSSIRHLFDSTSEVSISSWFMITQTFVAALVLWVVFLIHRDLAQSKPRMAGWGFLAGFFTYMAADDGAMIHEAVGSVFYDAFGAGKNANTEGFMGQIQALFPSYEWQLVVLPILVAAGVFMLIFLWREFHTRAERMLLVSAATCMGFAVGLDFIEGLAVRHPWNLRVWFAGKFDIHLHAAAHYSRSLEESLEMLAMSLLLMLFLRHLIRLSQPGLTFSFSGVKHVSSIQ